MIRLSRGEKGQCYTHPIDHEIRLCDRINEVSLASYSCNEM